MAAWPVPNEYREAIQCPKFCFRDRDLKESRVVEDRQGLPLVSSGNFASVYSLELPLGGRVAIRCFNHRFPDQELRYREISSHLESSKLPYTVDFRFVSEGILVNGEWYPILRMEWVQGDSLISYVEKNLGRKDMLSALAKQWMQMCSMLQRSGIAHGDLQHGNIMIDNGEIRLIDYDGMYVPALAGLPSNERGHSNYQHPQRNAEFGPQLDNFSAWTIYCSLLLLRIDPSLWQQQAGHEEFLLFRDLDFKSASDSVLLQLLENHESRLVRQIAAQLKTLINADFDQLPFLDQAAPLPQEEMDEKDLLAILGLVDGVSGDDIREAAALWARVWDPQYYRKNARLQKHVLKKLAKIEMAVDALLNP